MKYILSRFNHDINWIKKYTNDYVIYDRSPVPVKEAIVVPNIGSNIYDFFSFIIDNYNSLPDCAVFAKCNLFKYITYEEFDLIKDNTTFTPILTKNHVVYEPVCRYTKDGLYEEVNNFWYLNSHPCKSEQSKNELIDLLGLRDKEYLKFAPGSCYILTKQDILRHSREAYIKLRSFLDWTVYGGECQIMERALYYLWGTDIIRL